MSDESLLCTACGLCCTGALHDAALLSEDEVEAAVAIGLPVLPSATPPRFALPCPKFDGAICTIYEIRPRACAAYSCRLLEEVRAGCPLASALEIVGEARRLAETLRQTMPPGETFADSRAHLFDQDRPAAAQLSSLALSHYLDRHFRNRNEGPLLSSEPAQ
ncbi:YkgJ family cysteine cluster protein [Sphingomonas kaistensis]|uniref:YkgJ family cysteine cluster protein n=1 Tax=Sphingomonas kaistensis TaxID=298708 RepID=A0ABZ2G3D7_9SPHN